MILIAAVVGVLLLLALGGIWWIRKSALDTEKDRLSQAQTQIATLTKEKESLSEAAATQAEVDKLQGQVETVLATDISWARMLQEIARTIPNDTWLTAFQGSSSNAPGSSSSGASTLTPSPTTTPTTAGGHVGSSESTTTTTSSSGSGDTSGTLAPTTTPAPTTAGGTATFSVVGLDFRSVAAWIQRIGTQIPSFSDLWVPNASRGGQTSAGSGRDFVNFSSTANITAAARSDRLDKAKRAAK